MATGIEKMLKSFGIDPEKIKEGVSQIAEAVQKIDQRMKAIEERNERIEKLLLALLEYQVPEAERNYEHINQLTLPWIRPE